MKLFGSKMKNEEMDLDLYSPWNIRSRENNLQMCFSCLKQCSCSHDLNRHIACGL